jgi:hypothetical protein
MMFSLERLEVRHTPKTIQVTGTANGTTTFSSMEEQRQKKANEHGLPSTAYSNTK